MLAYLNSSAKLVDDGILPCHEIALLDMMAGIGHEAQIEREVVDAGYLHRQQLLGLEEVVGGRAQGHRRSMSQPSGSTGLKSFSHFLLRMFIVP